ncbi:MAG: HPr family phosphocarrier protein [Verrucomicrobiota bacterium]
MKNHCIANTISIFSISSHMTSPVADQSEAGKPESSASFSLTVSNKMGIHARPAAMIVRIANRFSGDVWVEKDGEKVNGKSIMGLMMLAAGPGSVLKFSTAGGDTSTMKSEMTDLFEKKFEES